MMTGNKNYYSGDDIYQKLKEDILTLALKPGQMISENEIASVYGVSRTPVKTALLRLKGEKFIEIIPQKGSFVTLLDTKYIKDIIYMRAVLETDVAGTIIDRGLPDQVIPVLEANLQEQHRLTAVEKVDPPAFYEVDSAFHYSLFKAVGLERIWDVIQDLQVYYKRFRMLDIMSTARYKMLCTEHEGIVQALRERDKAALKTRISDHMHGNLRTLAPKIEGELKDYFLDPKELLIR